MIELFCKIEIEKFNKPLPKFQVYKENNKKNKLKQSTTRQIIKLLQKNTMSSKHMFQVTEPTVDAIKASGFAQNIYKKCLRSPSDLSNWKRSQAYYDVVAYINNTSMAIQGHRQTGGSYVISSQMHELCKIFNWLDRLACECHPMGIGEGLMSCLNDNDNGQLNATASTNSMRHKCHLAYRRWLLQVQEKIFGRLERQLRPNCKHINELAQYLTRSFGSIKSNNYDLGHELMFVFFLCALFKCGILQSEDTVAAALVLYQRYVELVRRILLFYRLATLYRDNNAIDERNALPYLWGCAQLCRDAPFNPLQCQKAAQLEPQRREYMLLSSLEYLQRGKGQVPLGVHSHQLWCVLSLSNWPDAYASLMRTYIKYVLDDFYIVQHLIFSEIMSFARQPAEFLVQAYLGKKTQPELPLLPPELPVSRHNSLDTQLFLGFNDPRKQSIISDDDYDNEKHQRDDHVHLLRRPRKYRHSFTAKPIFDIHKSESMEAMTENNIESKRSKRSTSRIESPTSYYSL